jgi:hypothetical protein
MSAYEDADLSEPCDNCGLPMIDCECEERKYDRGQKIVSIRPCRLHGPSPTRYANSGHCVACATGR